jgi:uncharacterized protein (TIGR00369 family)
MTAVHHDQSRSGRKRHVPFSEHLGLRVERAEGGDSLVTLELRPEMLNNHASGHGGVVMTLLDSAMAHAALSRLDYAREVVTLDMHIAFMRPASGRLVAKGRATGAAARCASAKRPSPTHPEKWPRRPWAPSATATRPERRTAARRRSPPPLAEGWGPCRAAGKPGGSTQ